MKVTNKLITIFSIFLLSLTLIITPTVRATAFTSLDTGDWFSYDIDNIESRSDTEASGFSYAAGIQDFMNHSMSSSYNQDGTGYADIGIIRDYPGPGDTILDVYTNMISNPGSNETWSETGYDEFNQPNPRWSDSQYTDTAGMSYEDDHSERSGANDTYAMMFDGMSESQISYWVPWMNFPFFIDFQNSNFTGFGGERNATLNYRNVVSSNATYTVNGVDTYFDTFNVSSSFNDYLPISYGNNMTIELWEFGAGNVTLNYDLSLSYNSNFNYVYDQTTGILLEMYESSWIWMSFSSWTSNFTATVPDVVTSLDALVDATYYFSSQISDSSSMWVSISDAYSHFGNVRPVSAGTAPLSEGDSLSFDTYKETTVDSTTAFGSGGRSMMNTSEISDGWFDIDVFRHDTGLSEAVLYNHQNVNYEHSEKWPDGSSWQEMRSEFRDNYELIDFAGNSTYDIIPFFENAIYFGDDNDKRGSNDNPFNDFNMTLDSVTIDTVYDTYIINGYSYYMELTEVTAAYSGSLQYSAYWMQQFNTDAVVDIWGNANETFYYDSWTGAFVGHVTELEAYMDFSGSFYPPAPPSGPASPLETFTGATDVYSFDEWTLDTISNEYLGPQTSFPTSPTAPPTNTTTSTSTTTPSNTTSSTSTTPAGNETSAPSNDTAGPSTPQLPVPISFAPVASSFLIAAVVLRKRNK